MCPKIGTMTVCALCNRRRYFSNLHIITYSTYFSNLQTDLSLTFKAKIQKFLSWNLTTETENFVMSTFKLCINSYIENSGIIHIIPLKIPKITLTKKLEFASYFTAL